MPPLIPKAGLFRLKIDGMAHVFHAVEDVGNGSPPPAAGVGKDELGQIKKNYTAAISSFKLARTELGSSINAEMLSLLSEMTETSIIVIPFMPEQRYLLFLRIPHDPLNKIFVDGANSSTD